MKCFLTEKTFIALIVLLCIVIGYFIVEDYGISWDEPHIYNYGEFAIGSYKMFFHPKDVGEYFYDHLNYYGPAHFMLARITSNLVLKIDPTWSVEAANHFIYYLTFLSGTLALYLLSKRWMSKMAAMVSALLFATQPLILGHAFINPKDTPFMSFFIISIYFGNRIFDNAPKIKWHKVLIAGAMLGLTTSMRVIAPMAGGIVLLYGLIKFPRTSLRISLPYAGMTVATMYLTWPYLWKAPIFNFLESIKMVSNFPFEGGETLFMGKMFPITQLPLRYIPSVLAFQFTESALVLLVIGFFIAFASLSKKKNWEPFFFFLTWFFIPTFWLIVTRSTLYDNARQLLFLWPPLFIFAGIGFDKLLQLKETLLWRLALTLLAVLPGIYSCMQLHPYEYIYYNTLVGGVEGAARQYELDYWGTSFKEAMEYINQNADPETQVVVTGPRFLARFYARPDLLVIGPHRLNKNDIKNYYSLCLTRNNDDLQERICTKGDLVYRIERTGGILSYVNKHAH